MPEGRWFGEMGGEMAAMKVWEAPDMGVYGQGAWVHALWGRGSQVRLRAPGKTHGREGLVRGRDALEEPGCSMRSSKGEAREAREVVG